VYRDCSQILVAGNLNAVAESLIFAKKQGVDMKAAINAVTQEGQPDHGNSQIWRHV
jgi:3-hydroxyisobutyrate dehydrogenase-like beta-hydroxyacid dehydrogenase